jgi:hypothetical protein
MVSGPLAIAGLQSMSPQKISDYLEAHGCCYTFRLEWQYKNQPSANSGLISGYSQIWCIPPTGKVTDFAYGTSGELIVFVSDPAPRTPGPNTPQQVGC